MDKKFTGFLAMLLSLVMVTSSPISLMASEAAAETVAAEEAAEQDETIPAASETVVGTDPSAAGNEEVVGSNYYSIEPEIEVNPLYADVVDPEDLVFEASEEALVGSGEVPVATTFEEFGENYRRAFDEMVSSHGTECSAVYETVATADVDAEYLTDLMLQLRDYAKANQFIHSGIPTAGDYAKWNCGGSATGASCTYGSTIVITVTTQMSYYITEEMESELTAKLEEVMASLELDTKTEYGKIKAIYDYIATHVTYDYENLNNDDYTLKHTAYAALINGTAVCQGYSSLFYRMALAAGLDARCITGDGSPGQNQGSNHGWNIVRLKGLYYNMDVTWESEGNPADYNFFLKAHNSEDFPQHGRDAEFDTAEFHTEYPMATSNYVVVPSDLLTASPTPKIVNVSTCTVSLSPTSYTYNGSARKPAVTVKNGSTTLTLGTDYTVSYKNNTNAGIATATITGKGGYTGTVAKTFVINKATPKVAFANASVSKEVFDEAFVNALTTTSDGKVTFKSSNTAVAAVNSTSGEVTIKGIGVVIITANTAAGTNYSAGSASFKLTVSAVSIAKATVSGVSRSYGYSGRIYTPVSGVKVNGVALVEGKDFTISYKNNQNPGTATITITGIGNYTGTRVKTFEIVDCVSTLQDGKTYQFIPKNNSATAVCSFAGRMVNNTKVYITDRSASEAMRFKAVRNADGTWKFINAKCELVLAVQKNSSLAGTGTVLYEQTTRKAQNWRLLRKSDNSFAIINAASGLYLSMSDASAPKGTTLSMQKSTGKGEQRFYIVETNAVNAPYDGTYAVKASKDRTFGLQVAASSKVDGANVNLYRYSNMKAKRFKFMYSGGGYYRLVNVNSGMVLTVEGNTKKSGANVVQSKWKAQSGQRWKVVANLNGTVTFKNALGTVLQLSGNRTANRSNVVARKASTTGAQRWYLE